MQRIRFEKQDIDLLKAQLDELAKAKPGIIKGNIVLNVMQAVKVVQPKIYITASAYVKMMTIVKECNGEIGWHLLMSKHRTGIYELYDILIYPQKASAAYIEVDDEERAKWQNKLDVNTFKAIHGQIHSHVNMSCTPSGVDNTHYTEVTALIKPNKDNYYLFAIVNKKGEFWANFYDYEQNTLFETKDISFIIMDEKGIDIIEQTKQQIKDNLKQRVIPSPYCYYESEPSDKKVKKKKSDKQMSIQEQVAASYAYQKELEDLYDRYD